MQATFSIGVVDPSRGLAGVATASRYLAVGALTIHAAANAGIVITQSIADRTHATRALPLLAAGEAPRDILQELLREDSRPDIRQIALINMEGVGVSHSGERCIPVAAEERRPGLVALGNMLASDRVPAAMADRFEEIWTGLEIRSETGSGMLSAGNDPGRAAPPGATQPDTQPRTAALRDSVNLMAVALVAALGAGERAGGDKRGKQAAAVLVVGPGAGYGGSDDRGVDLRVDDHRDPVAELERLLRIFRELQAQEYAE
jgi:uncharacterized Ntn-hydrolase superfamily protein